MKSRKSRYRCPFCRENLVTTSLTGLDYVWVFLLLWPYQCPHCFCCYRRPFRIFAYFPVVGRLLGSGSTSRSSPRIAGFSPSQETDVHGPVTRILAKTGRLFESAEEKLWAIVSAPFRMIWKAGRYITRPIRRRRRRSKDRFLPHSRH